MSDTKLVMYCNRKQERQADAYDLPILSCQNSDSVKVEGKMRKGEAHRTSQKDNLSTLGAAQDSWGFVAKACRGRRGVGSNRVLGLELKETGIFSELTCGSNTAFQGDNPSSCWTNPLKTQWDSFHTPTPLVRFSHHPN